MEKNEEIISRNCLPHHKSQFLHKYARSSPITFSPYFVKILSNEWERVTWRVLLITPRQVTSSLWWAALVTPRWRVNFINHIIFITADTLWLYGEFETWIIMLCGSTYTIWHFTVYFLHYCKATLMIITKAVETC